jgi:small subunit ribosomal protein S2
MKKKEEKKNPKLSMEETLEDQEEMETSVEEEQQASDEGLLVPLNIYLSTGIHIGMSHRVKGMMPYIYKIRQDKLSVFDIQKIDQRLALGANFLAQYDPKDVLVVSRKKNGIAPARKFAEVMGARAIAGRFMPGTLTNPNYVNYIEPKVIVLTDPFADKQAIDEAYNANIPIVAMCDTYNDTKNIDVVLPLNNKGKKSVALAYWILAREIMKKRGDIKGDAEFKPSVDDFENFKKRLGAQ